MRGITLDKWKAKAIRGEGWDVATEPVLRICCMCCEIYEADGDALDPICPDCIDATAVCDWED